MHFSFEREMRWWSIRSYALRSSLALLSMMKL
jgi:hypothetical protein